MQFDGMSSRSLRKKPESNKSAEKKLCFMDDSYFLTNSKKCSRQIFIYTKPKTLSQIMEPPYIVANK